MHYKFKCFHYGGDPLLFVRRPSPPHYHWNRSTGPDFGRCTARFDPSCSEVSRRKRNAWKHLKRWLLWIFKPKFVLLSLQLFEVCYFLDVIRFKPDSFFGRMFGFQDFLKCFHTMLRFGWEMQSFAVSRFHEVGKLLEVQVLPCYLGRVDAAICYTFRG